MLREKEKNCAPTIETLLSQNVALCSRSLEIPSMSDMNGRVAVITWERGLDDHADEISHLMIMAIHVKYLLDFRVCGLFHFDTFPGFPEEYYHCSVLSTIGI